MLRLYLSNYKEEEVQYLHKVIGLALSYVQQNSCYVEVCKNCNHWNICGDLNNALDYLSEYKSNTVKHTQM